MGFLQVVLALDADFVVSAGLHEKLSSPTTAAALLEDVSIQRNVVVLPAFETESSLGLDRGSDIATKAQLGRSLGTYWPSSNHSYFPAVFSFKKSFHLCQHLQAVWPQVWPPIGIMLEIFKSCLPTTSHKASVLSTIKSVEPECLFLISIFACSDKGRAAHNV